MAMKTASTLRGLQTAAPQHRAPSTARRFHACTRSRASILFALNALSNSRETQHFNKISRLERVEHSPALKLIKTGEVDAVVRKENIAPAPPTQTPVAAAAHTNRRASPSWDQRALQVGRTILADNARSLHRASRALDRAHARAQVKERQMEADRLAWASERRKLQQDVRAASIWILVSIGVASGLATWRYWPGAADPRMKFRLVANEARQENGAATAVHAPVTASDLVPAIPAETQQAVPVSSSSFHDSALAPSTNVHHSQPWWRSLFWKRSGQDASR